MHKTMTEFSYAQGLSMGHAVEGKKGSVLPNEHHPFGDLHKDEQRN